ncbi:MAG: YcxB family protein, partial [Lachnospiraceae bacterium]|nr:YcxB family protein [Lachnospiraceae bacterium]
MGTISFDVKMTEKAMLDFFLYHTYSGLSGIFGVVFGFATLLFCIRAFSGGDQSAGMIFLFFTFFFWIFTPVNLKIKAKRQVEKTPMFQKPLHYE